MIRLERGVLNFRGAGSAAAQCRTPAPAAGMPAVRNSPIAWVEVWKGHGDAWRRAMYWRPR